MVVLLRASVAINSVRKELRIEGQTGADSGRWSGTNRLKTRGLSSVLALVNFSMREGVAAGRGEGAKQVTRGYRS